MTGMKKHRALAAALVSALCVIGALAFASPPDPTWIGGFYNDADFDATVFPITDAAPLSVVVMPVIDFEAQAVLAPPPGSDVSRAPPVA
jgi:hypothetical protein